MVTLWPGLVVPGGLSTGSCRHQPGYHATLASMIEIIININMSVLPLPDQLTPWSRARVAPHDKPHNLPSSPHIVLHCFHYLVTRPLCVLIFSIYPAGRMEDRSDRLDCADLPC